MRERDEELSKGWVQFVHTIPITPKENYLEEPEIHKRKGLKNRII